MNRPTPKPVIADPTWVQETQAKHVTAKEVQKEIWFFDTAINEMCEQMTEKYNSDLPMFVDDVLLESKNIAMGYFCNPTSIETLSNDFLFEMFNFLTVCMQYNDAISDSLGLGETETLPWAEMKNRLEQLKSNKMSDSIEVPIRVLLHKDFDYIGTQIVFTHLIFSRILDERGLLPLN